MSSPIANTSANSKRRLADASLQAAIALPAANATAVTASVDFGTPVLGPTSDEVEVQVLCPATPSLVDAKTITFTLKDSADNSSFAAIVGGPAPVVITGASSAGASALDTTVRLPWFTRRYLRLEAAVLTGGGDNTAVTTTMKVLANS